MKYFQIKETLEIGAELDPEDLPFIKEIKQEFFINLNIFLGEPVLSVTQGVWEVVE